MPVLTQSKQDDILIPVNRTSRGTKQIAGDSAKGEIEMNIETAKSRLTEDQFAKAIKEGRQWGALEADLWFHNNEGPTERPEWTMGTWCGNPNDLVETKLNEDESDAFDFVVDYAARDAWNEVERADGSEEGEEEETSQVISISMDQVWAGIGELINGRIEDCGAQFCDDTDESESVYELIEEAIEAGKDSVTVTFDDNVTRVIAWTLT